MATEKEKVAERVLRAAAAMFGGMLAGMASPGMIGPGGLGTGTATRILEGAAPGTVADYPKPLLKFKYDVDYIEGAPQNNAAYKGNPNPAAMRMQTIQQHNRALNKYIRPGMGTLELRSAIERGKEEEQKLDSFWTDDTHPRRPVRSSSSAVSDVVINTDGTLSVRFRNTGKWYTYRGGADPYEAAMSAHDLVTAPSLGKAINKKTGWWSVGAQHKLW
jgi:hypothetical protein